VLLVVQDFEYAPGSSIVTSYFSVSRIRGVVALCQDAVRVIGVARLIHPGFAVETHHIDHQSVALVMPTESPSHAGLMSLKAHARQ